MKTLVTLICLITTTASLSGDSVTFTTPSGIAYTILKAAPVTARSPKKGDTAVVHYTGWLDNKGKQGAKFDSSVDRKTPFTFKVGVGQVIQGWDEMVLAMKIGEKRRVTIPSHLAYGLRGAGGIIPPNATLIFEIELIAIT